MVPKVIFGVASPGRNLDVGELGVGGDTRTMVGFEEGEAAKEISWEELDGEREIFSFRDFASIECGWCAGVAMGRAFRYLRSFLNIGLRG